MIENPNIVWRCPSCGHEERGYEDGIKVISVWIRTKRCPRCDSLMEDSPILHKEPFPESPFKRY